MTEKQKRQIFEAVLERNIKKWTCTWTPWPEAAKLLGYSESTFKRMFRECKLPITCSYTTDQAGKLHPKAVPTEELNLYLDNLHKREPLNHKLLNQL